MPKKGGRHVSGESGCTFIPSLSLKDGKRDNRVVTKFFYDEKEYIKESEILLKVRAADIRQTITKNQVPSDIDSSLDINKIFLERSSAPSGEFENNGANCKNVPEDKSKALEYFNGMKYLQYPYSGIDLNVLIESGITFETSKNIIVGLSVLLKGLRDINRRGYFHNDIHTGNITYLDTEKKCYLIDFGMFEKLTDIRTDNCLVDLKQFITAVKLFVFYIVLSQEQKKVKTIPPTNLQILKLFPETSFKLMRENVDELTRIDPPSADIGSCNSAYDKVIVEFDKFVTNYTKLYGGKHSTKKQQIKNNTTLRRRKVGRNVH